MGKTLLPQHLDAIALAVAEGGGGPFSHAVHRHDGGLLKRAGKEGAGCVRLVVAGVDQRTLKLLSVAGLLQTAANLAFQKELLLDPDRDSEPEAAEPRRRVCQVGFQKALELDERFLVKNDVIHVLQLATGFFEAVADRVDGKPGVVLLAGKALLLGRADNPAVFNQGSGGIVVKRGNAENLHQSDKKGRLPINIPQKTQRLLPQKPNKPKIRDGTLKDAELFSIFGDALQVNHSKSPYKLPMPITVEDYRRKFRENLTCQARLAKD